MKKKPTKKHPPTKKPKPRGVEVVTFEGHVFDEAHELLSRGIERTFWPTTGPRPPLATLHATLTIHIPRKARR